MEHTSITIAVLLGTARPNNKSQYAAKYIAEFGKKLPDVEIIYVDPAELHFPGDGKSLEEKDPRYSEITAKADAFFVVSPEYNRSMPGSLKRMLDSELENYHRKPVALASTSGGPWGGVRLFPALQPVFRHLGMTMTNTDLHFPLLKEIFDESGQMKPEYRERYEKNVGAAYEELIWMARLFKMAA